MKKITLLFLALLLCFALAACGNSNNTNTTTPTDNSTSSIPDNTSGNTTDPDVPIMAVFSSVEQMQEFITVSKGTAEQYNTYIESNHIDFLITQKIARVLVTNMESVNIPQVNSNIEIDAFGATYYVDRNELDMIYRINNIAYSFVYRFNKPAIPMRTEEPVVKNVTLGTNTFNLYQGDESLVGYILLETATLQVIVRTDTQTFNSLNMFSFSPLEVTE